MKLIVEMEMPRNCKECAFSTGCSFCEGYDDHCVLAPIDTEYEWNFCDGIEPPERPSWCPIVGVLPEEHGDLIDRDAYLKLLESYIESKRGVCENKEFIVALQAIIKQIKCVKAVIAAERKDDGRTDKA